MYTSPELREALALRYEVYCVERGFLPSNQYNDPEETDEFDEVSAHFIARHAGRVVGNMREVRPFNTRFPFQQHCETFPDVKIRYRRSAELSRLAVAKMRLKEIGREPVGSLPDGKPVGIREAIVLCLIKAAVQYSALRRIDYLYVAMERSLTRLLGRMGIVFHPIGKETDYYGPVVPCFTPRKDLLAGMRAHSPALHAWMTDGIAPALGSVSVVTYDRSPLRQALRPRLKMLVQSLAATLRRGREPAGPGTVPRNRVSGLFGSWGLRSKLPPEHAAAGVLPPPFSRAWPAAGDVPLDARAGGRPQR